MMNEDSVQRLEVIQEQPSKINESSIWSQEQSQVLSNSFNDNDTKAAPKNKVSRSISALQATRQYQSNQEPSRKDRDSHSPQKRQLTSQQPSQMIKCKATESELLLKRMETLTNDKMKLRNMIQEHRRIIAQLQSEES
jgi:hypothetical protein